MRHSRLAKKQPAPVQTKSFSLKGGLNLVDAPLDIPAGMFLGATNYEMLTRSGCQRTQGHERYDGQGKPSDASYWILNYDAGTTAISEGDDVEGGTSGATGTALSDAVGTTAAGYVVLTNVTGTFVDDEDLEVSAAKVAEANGIAAERGASSPTLDSTYAQDAIETQRDLIAKPAGTGAIRGIHVFGGDRYCFRDNVGETECVMFKATTAGWVAQTLGNRISFLDAGAGVEYIEGEVITGTTSGASATITRVVLQSGDWGTDAAGYFIIGAVTAGPFQAEATTGDGSGAVPITGAETANTMAPGGKYEFRDHNFFGSTKTKRMYGVNGVSEAFEWDGTVFVPLITGNTVDTPSHIEINEEHLELAFQNGSLQNSASGTPYIWSGSGAGEIGLGQDIVGMQKEVGEAMAVICRGRTYQIQGKNTVASPWNKLDISTEAGGIEWTIQRLGRTRYLDDLGFVSLDAVQEYGDFTSTTYSQVIEPLVASKKGLAISSLIVKTKEQLRTFFSDGSGLVATFNNKKLVGFTPLLYRDTDGDVLIINCTANGEDSDGSEVIYYGGEDGFVYQADSGNSFDGYQVDATFVLTYNHLGTPAYDKQFKKVTIDAEGTAGTVIDYTTKLDYLSGREPAGISIQKTLTTGRSYWNDVSWNAFTWSGEAVTLIEGGIDGSGRTISLQLSSSATYAKPHKMFSLTYHYIMRKLVR